MPVLSVNCGSAINILYLLLVMGNRHSDHLTRGERCGQRSVDTRWLSKTIKPSPVLLITAIPRVAQICDDLLSVTVDGNKYAQIFQFIVRDKTLWSALHLYCIML